MSRAVRLGVDVGGLGPIQSGVARYLWNMLASITTVAPDLSVRLYSPRAFRVPLEEGNWKLRVDSSHAWMPYMFWIQHRFPVLLAEDRVDVVWGQNEMIPLKLKRPCLRVLTIHDATAVLFPHTMSKTSRLTSRLYLRRAVRVAGLILADSMATARLARALLGVPAETIDVIRPGCTESFVRVPDAESRVTVSARFGLKPGYLLTVGNIEPRKRLLELLAAIERDAGLRTLVVVGSPAWRSGGILSRLSRLEGAGRVRFLGRVSDDDLAALYSAAALMVYPSIYEGFGLPVLEAMSCGCPVLCRWSSSLPEVGGDAVAYFAGHDPARLADAIAGLLSDDKRLATMAAAGLMRARMFSYRQAALHLADLLRQRVLTQP